MINRIMLAISAVLGMAGLTIVFNLRPNHNEVLAGCSLCIFVVCLLPWIVLARRKVFSIKPAASQRWDNAIIILLFIALLAGPFATASYKLWLTIAKPTDAWGGFGPAIGFMGIAWLSHCIGFGACIIALLIQLWRDQWKRVMNCLAIAYQLLVCLFLCKVNG